MPHLAPAPRGVILLVSVLGAACAGSSSVPAYDEAVTPRLPEGHPVVEARALPDEGPAIPDGVTGVVLEALDGGGYMYVRLAMGGTERWVAGPPANLSVGDTVAAPDMVSMGSFRSPALDRSFDELFFTGAFQTTGQNAPGNGPATSQVVTERKGLVKQAIPAGAYVYLEVQSGDTTEWLAAPATGVSEGDTVGWNGGSPMRDFSSTALGRTFAEILFVSEVVVLR
ncbi:MAG TPA: hypothetical protein VLA36_09780 [Longimicrobiales bacterium]|nr:hypothetical protein [Longimicrobiales bacterium]